MTISFFARMLNPDLDIVIYKNSGGDTKPVSKVKARDAQNHKYADATIKDFNMCSSRPMARVDI